jgi:signal transduction histidine kinase
MTRHRTLRLVFALTLALVVIALGATSVLRKVQSFQTLGFRMAAPDWASGGVLVESVQDPGLGLKAGDQILLINGGEVGGPATLAEHLRKESHTGLLLMRDNRLVQLVYDRPALRVDVSYLILSLIGLVYLLIGLYTLLRQHRQTRGHAFLFFLWCLASAAAYLLSAVPPADLAFVLVTLGDEAARLLLPALTLHLFLVFPFSLGGRTGRRLIPFLYLPGAALFALQLDLGLTNGRWIFGTPTDARLQLLDRVEIAQLALFALASVALLARRLIVRRGWEHQRQTQWVAAGLAGGYLPFLALYGIPFLLGFHTPEVLRAASVLPLALVPVAFAWAILRYKLWDIEVIVRDTISLTMTLMLGLIGFSMVNLAINRGISQELSLARNLLSFAAGLGIAGLLVPTRAGISSALERFQYRGIWGKRRALSDLGRELLHERDLGRLCDALLREMEEGVDLEHANLYLCQGDALVPVRPDVGLPARLDFSTLSETLGESFWRKDALEISGLALPLESLTPVQQVFIAGYRYAFPLTVRGRGIGIALAGYRRDQTPLNSDDTELIRQLLNQASLAIENAQLVGQLSLRLQEVQSLQRYSDGIFESSPAGIAVLDRIDGVGGGDRLVSANAAFGAISGLERDHLIGRPLAEVLPVSPLPETGTGPVEVTFRDAAGCERHLQVSLAAFDARPEDAGKPSLRVLVVHDVSERVAMENALREQDRLAALGMLAAGVAHEVNTPITGISSYAQMLLLDTPEGHPHHEILKKVERQTFRAARIVNNLLELARDRKKEQRPVALAPLLAECVDLLGERLEKKQIELVWELPAEDVVVMGCDGELQQVFTNLIVNAFDAMSGHPGCTRGGRLTIRVEAGIGEKSEKARVHIQDTGPGIPPEKLAAIFQPFYSTKLNRGGTGLGLSISAEIVRRHGGRLEAESRPGEGACFLVELPTA